MVELRHEADPMEQTEDNVHLVCSTIWSKPGQSCRRALIAAGVILVVCAIASGIGGTWLPLGTRMQPISIFFCFFRALWFICVCADLRLRLHHLHLPIALM